MKIKLFVVFFCFILLAEILSSCCSDDKYCPAGNPEAAGLPYTANETIQFADSAGHRIFIRMADEIKSSAAYQIDGSCSMPRKEMYCGAHVSLSHASFTDSADIIPFRYRNLACSIDQSGDGNDLWISGLGGSLVSIFKYGKDNIVYNATELAAYTTPFRTYTNVYRTVSVMPVGRKSITVFTLQGRLVSFTIPTDTTRVFYVVE
jgi:hypothetical protein